MSAELSPLQRAFLALEETRARLATAEGQQREPIAIIGVGCRFPATATSPAGYWQLLREGRSGVSTVPAARWDHAPFFDPSGKREGTTYAQHAGFISAPVEAFDASFFGISPREAAAMDPQQRLLLEVTWQALEHAGIAPDRLVGSATGVFTGIAAGDYAQLQLRGGTLADIDAHYASGIAHSIASGRVSYLLGLQGPSLSIDTACSSSLVAVHLACQSLRTRESNMALAAGVNLILTPESFIAFSRTHMLAQDGRCKPFDASADGFVRGEGCGVIVLKRLSDAVSDGDRVLAVIRSSAVNQDGASASLTAPSGPAQEAVIRRALALAALSPNDVQFVEAHGTGTSLGDPIELRALGAVYGAQRAADEPLLVGSVKANFGHLEGAAGVASVIKAVLALGAAQVPGQLHMSQPTPHVDWESLRLRVPAAAGEAWPKAATRRAAVSSFGFSGTNAHVILEQAPAPFADRVPSASDRPLLVVPIAARALEAVCTLASAYAGQLEGGAALADLAHTAATRRAQLSGARAVVVAGDADTARTALLAIAAGDGITLQRPGLAPRVAFLFTGQGSQYPGMARELYDTVPGFRASIAASDSVLSAEWGSVSLLDVLFGSQAEVLLTDARYVQPAIVAVELALSTLWRSWGVEPLMVAGHSLGEYAAAAFAGVMSDADALRLVAARGRLMAALPEVECAMTSVPASAATVRAVLDTVPDAPVELAADNGATQCVLTGTTHDIARAEAAIQEQLGLESRRLLATTNAFHSRLIEPMLDAFEQAASTIAFSAPRLPVQWNLGAAALAPNQAPTARYWRQQTRHAVQFGDAIAALRDRGITHAIEIGPHPVLTGLVAAADDATLPIGVASLRRGRGAWETLAAGVARWWADGGTIDWVAFDRPYARRRIDLPTYPFAQDPHWLNIARVGHVRPNPAHGHPLVGAPMRSPAITGVVCERELSVQALSLLHDHRVHGRAILPGAAWLDALATAGAQAFPGTTWSVTGLTLLQALQVPDDRPRTMQLVLAPSSDGTCHAAAYSRDAATPAGEWTQHAQATLVARAAPADTVAVSLPGDAVSVEAALYGRFARVGLTLGPPFQLVRRAVRHERNAIVSIDANAAPAWPYGVAHPVLIDACIQAIALALPEAEDVSTSLFMPLAVERFSWHGKATGPMVCHATLRDVSSSGESVVADVTAYDEHGCVIGQLVGVSLKRATPEALQLASAGAVRESLYRIEWEPKPLPAGGAVQAADAVPLSVIAQRVMAQGPRHASATTLDRYAVDGPITERLGALYVWAALRQLGASLLPGARLKPVEFVSRHRVQARHVQLVARFLDMLVEDGVMHRDGEAYVVAHVLDPDAIPTLVQQLRAADTPFTGELNLLVRCGENLALALTGDVDPLALLFPNGSLDEVHRIYRDSPFPKTYNALVRDAVAALVAGQADARTLRVLEVGGGTGGTTEAVLQAIPDERCSYTFTDASPLFLTKARDRFASRSGVAYRVFDLEKDALAQGFETGSVDLIVAANVVHATRDVASTLTRLRQLLSPGGMLLMLEVSRPSRWVDLSFGFTEGWWAFDDAFRTDYPLLPSSEWTRVLRAAGFPDVSVALGTAGSGAGLEEQSMVLARTAPAAAASADGSWVVLCDAGGTGAAIARRLSEAGARVTMISTVSAGAPATSDDRVTSLVADATDRAELTKTLDAVGRAGGLSSVLNCLPLDAGQASPRGDAGVAAAASASATSAITVAQAVLTFGGNDTTARPTLWNVTQSAVRTSAGDDAPSLVQSPVWGVARTLQLEHPELQVRCVDLPLRPSAVDVDALARELLAPTPERQVALRNGARLVARLDTAAALTPAFPAAYRVASRVRGTIESLEISAGTQPAPGPGEVVIRVVATGLNFKDVLNVLGTYPGDAGAIGGECAGYVTGVGEGVTTHRIGARVVGIAQAAMGSHVVTPATLVVWVPDGMAMDDAAALPIAYLTAYHTLIELARLQRGERVLIHAGAGGVGMAAVHLALRAGAEVFATAGSDAKRAFLRELGVSHVLDSRQLSFADEVMARTGGEGVHVTLNSLSDAFVERSLAVTARGGRFIEIGKRGIWSAEQVAALGTQLEYHIVDWTNLARTEPARIGEALRTLLYAVEQGTLPPLPVQVFPLSRMHDAFRYMAQGRHTGKIVISHREALDGNGALPTAVVPGAAYVIAGGTSGLGLLTAEWLARRGATHLVLCSRSGGNATTAATADRMRTGGVRVDIVSVDVSDSAALGALLERVRGVSPIRGVIQSAGALDDGAVLQLDASRVERVFASKVTGTWNLHVLTAPDALDFFVCYASVAGVFGSAGQANHAAANAFIDALAHRRRAEGRCAVSIDWGAWDEIGAAVRHGVLARAAGLGVGSITPADGLRMLSAVFSGSDAQVVALPIDWQTFLAGRPGAALEFFERMARRASIGSANAPSGARHGSPDSSAGRTGEEPAREGSQLLADLTAAVAARRPALLRAYLRDRVARTLGLPVGQIVEDQQPLRDAGLDSLLAIELRNALGTVIGRSLPATLLFDYPTVDDLATYLLGVLFPAAPDAVAVTPPEPVAESPASLLDDLDEMSDDDVERMLADKLRNRK